MIALDLTPTQVRTHLGVETQRQWNDRAVTRTTPALLGLFSLVTLPAHPHVQDNIVSRCFCKSWSILPHPLARERQVGFARLPVVADLHQHGAHQPQARLLIGEEARHPCPTFHLTVEVLSGDPLDAVPGAAHGPRRSSGDGTGSAATADCRRPRGGPPSAPRGRR